VIPCPHFAHKSKVIISLSNTPETDYADRWHASDRGAQGVGLPAERICLQVRLSIFRTGLKPHTVNRVWRGWGRAKPILEALLSATVWQRYANAQRPLTTMVPLMVPLVRSLR